MMTIVHAIDVAGCERVSNAFWGHFDWYLHGRCAVGFRVRCAARYLFFMVANVIDAILGKLWTFLFCPAALRVCDGLGH